MKIRHLAPVGLAAGLAMIAGTALANQHDAKPKPAAKAEKPQAESKSGPEYATRDWAKIDTNKDHLISPEEMEAYLAANPGPLRAAAKK